MSAEFLEWVSSREGRPFFAFLNYYDAHDPYRPPAPFDRKFEGAPRPDVGPIGSREWPEPLMGRWIDAYDGAIAYLDQELDALFTELHRRGIADNTLVVLTSDHGEEFAEHGLVTHGQSLYLSSLHVPLLVRYPGETPRGVRVRQPGSLRDVPATITDLLDGSSADAAFPGATLARHWRTASIDSSVSRPAPPIAQTSGKEWLPDESTAPIARGDLVSVFVDGYHVIRNGDGALEMYDLRSDYWEQDDLAATSAKRDLLERLERTMLLPLAQRYADRPGRETAGRRPSQRVTVARDGARIP